MKKYPQIYLALDNCVFYKRWTTPDRWAAIIKDLGINYIEASADTELDPLYMGKEYLEDWVYLVQKAEREYDVKVCNSTKDHESGLFIAFFFGSWYDVVGDDMKEYYPNYYHKFRCIAGECRHSCCIGWEIDIDLDTYELYQSLNSLMGEKIRANIEGDPPHFKLGVGERCPFLDENGLCEIIREHGDGALCDICYLHPRFTNTYTTFQETGLGLCCEEAARIILTEKAPFSIRRPFWMTLKERRFFREQKRVLKILQDRTKTMTERMALLAEAYGIEKPQNLKAEFLALERLDGGWTAELEKIQSDAPARFAEEKQMEQFAAYLVFRHWSAAWEDYNYQKVVCFVIKSCYLLLALVGVSDLPFSELARMFSAEVEYSDENLKKLLK